MSETNPAKRSLEEDVDGSNKKSKTIEMSNVELDELKESITSEIWQKFEAKFSKLERQIDELKGSKTSTHNDVPKHNNAATLRPKTPPVSENKPKHTFGGSSFKLGSNKSFGSNSVTSTSEDVPTVPNTRSSSPKHVFGATSSFGNSMKGKNIFDSAPPQPASQDAGGESNTAPSLKSSFGAGSKYANAFQSVLKKKSFLDSEEAQLEEKPSTPEKVAEQYKKVDLQPVKEIKTGEENEMSHFSSLAKIFELDLTNISDGWKERGVGPLHLNQSLSDSTKVRLVMRFQGLLRLILNMRITSETKFMKGLEASLNPGKFLRFNTLNAEKKPVQYMLKFGSQTQRDELTDKIEKLQQTISVEQNGSGEEDR